MAGGFILMHSMLYGAIGNLKVAFTRSRDREMVQCIDYYEVGLVCPYW